MGDEWQTKHDQNQQTKSPLTVLSFACWWLISLLPTFLPEPLISVVAMESPWSHSSCVTQKAQLRSFSIAFWVVSLS